MKRKPSGRDLPTSAAMAAALVVLAALYGAALAAPLWLWSVGFLPWHYAFGADATRGEEGHSSTRQMHSSRRTSLGHTEID
jgi:hypothetical protein